MIQLLFNKGEKAGKMCPYNMHNFRMEKDKSAWGMINMIGWESGPKIEQEKMISFRMGERPFQAWNSQSLGGVKDWAFYATFFT